MIERHDDMQPVELSAKQKAAAAAVSSLGRPEPREAFRARLRAGFVAGSLAIPALGRKRSHRLTWLAPLAAAAILLAMLLRPSAPPLQWQVVGIEAAHHVVVDGQRIAAEAVPAVLASGRVVRVPEGGRVELLSPGLIFLQLNGGVEVALPARDGDDLSSRVGGEGTLRVATGPRFAGERYRLKTDAAQMEITGTVFAVINGHGDTCICVLEGNVRACAPDTTAMEAIEAGGRMTFHDFGRDVGRGRMLAGEEEELSRIRARRQELFSQNRGH